MEFQLMLAQNHLRSLNKMHFKPAVYADDISEYEAKHLWKVILGCNGEKVPSIPTVFYIWKKEDRFFGRWELKFSLFHGSLKYNDLIPQEIQYLIKKLRIYNIFGLDMTGKTLKSPIVLGFMNNIIDYTFDKFMENNFICSNIINCIIYCL